MGRTEILIDGLTFPESPRWHDGRLWFSDYFDHVVMTIDAYGSTTIEARVPGQPSGIGWLPDGQLLVVSRSDRRVLRRDATGALVEHADLSDTATGDLNEMFVDSSGRAYVTNLGFDPLTWFQHGGSFRDIPTSVLIRVDPDSRYQVVASDLRVPNGAALTDDGRRLLLAESFASRVIAFAVDPTDGSLSDPVTWAKLPGRTPDGISLDTHGRLWISDARASECVLVSEGGDVLEVVRTTQTCFGCALGGADGRTLFCLTAPATEETGAVEMRRGRVEGSTVDVPAPRTTL